MALLDIPPDRRAKERDTVGIKLRTCPFCNQLPEIKQVKFGMEAGWRFGIMCHNCSICVGWEDSEAAAIERWNRREGEKVD